MHSTKVSRITLGTAQLGFNYGISGNTLKDTPADILNLASRSGIDMVDTASAYGNSEEMIGTYLKGKRAARLNVITKIRIESTLAYDMRKEVLDKASASMARLGVRRLYGLLLHNYASLDRFGGDLVDAMADLKEEGMVEKIGVSVYDEKELRVSAAYDAFEIFQGPVNIFNHNLRTSGLIERLEEQEKVFFARSVFLQGLIFLDDIQLAGKVPEARPYIEKLRRLSEEHGVAIGELAFLYANSVKGVASLVLGVKRMSQLKYDAAMAGKALSQQLITQIETLFADVPRSVYDPRQWPHSSKE